MHLKHILCIGKLMQKSEVDFIFIGKSEVNLKSEEENSELYGFQDIS